jgi:glycosyltransferase involved in cell wall biosynthesis
MKIGIDGYLLSTPYFCGTKRYAENLIRALSEIDKRNTYYIYVFSETHLTIKQKNIHFRLIPQHYLIGKKQIILSRMIAKDNIDVFHNLDPYGSITNPCNKIVTTVHDIYLGRMLNNQISPKGFFQFLYMSILRLGVFHKTKAFICISNHIKQDLLKEFNLQTRNKSIFTIYNGVDLVFTNHYTKHRSGIVAFHDFSKKKNIRAVINSYARLPKILQEKNPLYIVVSDKILISHVSMLLKQHNVFGFAKIYHSLSDEELAKLYSQCICLLYPSLYEGFGIPIIEAMASGCVVLTTRFGATREVGGNAAKYINPDDSIEISNVLCKVLLNKVEQEDLRMKGLVRARQFSWLYVAREMIKIYEQVYKN